MGLHASLLADLSTAMKAKEIDKVAVLRMLKASLLNVSKEDGTEELADDAVVAILTKEAKKRKESEAAFAEGGRDDLVKQEQMEREIIEQYLPEQMSEDDIRTAVKNIADGMGAAQFGAVMGAAMKELSGQADGNVVKKIVQEVLQ